MCLGVVVLGGTQSLALYYNIRHEDSLKQWTNMPPISEELYQELVKEFNNERHYFFNDSYTLED